MKKLAVLLVFSLFILSGCNSGQRPHGKYILWYNTPAKEWTEALPIGNGRLGGMLFGNPAVERLQVNEEFSLGRNEYSKQQPGGAGAPS